jgi:PBP4 family serine-type D-alanyl-D-alanine carboxypeptidase
VLYERDADRVMVPASNTKLVTSAAAISLLGGDFRYRTRVLASGELSADGTLNGDLILEGGGDPTLSFDDLKKLAGIARAAGIQRVSGSIRYDDSYLDAERYGFGWNIDDEPFGYQAQMSGLSVERNSVQVYASPGAKVGEPVNIRLVPATDYLTVINRAVTHAEGARASVSVTRRRAQNVLEISGGLALKAEEGLVGRYSVEEPSRYAAVLFRDALKEAGVEVGGYPTALFALPPSPRVIAEHQSPPLSEILAMLNKPSDNLIAETLIKTLGKVKRYRGSTAAGLEVVSEFLKGAGLEMNAALFEDGSGLSRMNAISAKNLVRLLEFMWKSPHQAVFLKSLPVMGVDGTLRNRLRDTPVQGKAFAKTGSLYRVSALSGYVTTQSGETLVFSILMNFYTATATDARNLQNEIVKLLYERW